ncbi:MAG TPA: hypothetical protein PKW76_15490 [bacterium]|nr:hypothetical protein [bacterium]HPG47079.1 hypothetical protein [bacterium]HPM99333.1 hypothetical protein [bacterium]
MPWFFDKVTDYVDIPDINLDFVFNNLKKMEPFSFNHIVDVIVPKEPFYKHSKDKSHSANIDIVTKEDVLKLHKNFNGIIHFIIINRRSKPERDVRLIIKFPTNITIQFDPGSLDGSTKVQRNEIFDMRQTSPGVVRMYWASLPIGSYKFEIRINVQEIPENNNHIELLSSSENIIGWREKHIEFTY